MCAKPLTSNISCKIPIHQQSRYDYRQHQLENSPPVEQGDLTARSDSGATGVTPTAP
jgi:hypothetical protein